MGILTHCQAQDTIRGFKDLEGNAVFEDADFPVLMADVFGLQV